MPVSGLLVLVKTLPDSGPGGTSTSSRIMQVSFRISVPKTYEKNPVGNGNEELTVPPQLLRVKPVAVIPLNAASRSSENAISVTVSVELRLVSVNSRLTVSPGWTGSSVNSLVISSRVELTSSTSTAG